MSLKPGQQVILVGTDGFMPPIGSLGEIVGSMDSVGDCEVWFYDHPCPVAEPTWEIPAIWLVPILKPGEAQPSERESTHEPRKHSLQSAVAG